MTRAREIAKFINATARLTNVPTPDLTNLNASNLTSGTIPSARVSSGSVTQHVDLSNLNASNLTSGTVPNARYGTPTFDGSNLTNMSVSSSSGSWSLGHSHCSLSVTSARYVKVGRICQVAAYGYSTSNAGSGGTIVYLTGLPFTSWNSGSIVGGGTISYYNRFGGAHAFNILIKNNSTRIYMRATNAQKDFNEPGTDEMSIRNDWISNKYFHIAATYMTAS